LAAATIRFRRTCSSCNLTSSRHRRTRRCKPCRGRARRSALFVRLERFQRAPRRGTGCAFAFASHFAPQYSARCVGALSPKL
jgi:hypothetical protein